ncbi:MAG: AraC family transcriptional regulator [Cyclobacteriaceae bacterium]
MHLTQFPDIHWLRNQAETNFSNGRGVNNAQLAHQGWPSVVLNTTTSGTERNNIKGPFSLFLNTAGNSIVKSEGRHFNVTPDSFCTINNGQYYDLIIPERQTTTTFNIHFGHSLLAETLQAFNATEALLEGDYNQLRNNLQIKPHTIFLDKHIRSLTCKLQLLYKTSPEAKEVEELLLHEILTYIIRFELDLKQCETKIKSLKKSTQSELLSRLLVAQDYIHSNYSSEISTETLSKVSSLSKFHFIRTFKEAFGSTPHQYISKVRLNKAKDLLLTTKLPVKEISMLVGFKEPNSFLRFFKMTQGEAPAKFRS